MDSVELEKAEMKGMSTFGECRKSESCVTVVEEGALKSWKPATLRNDEELNGLRDYKSKGDKN